MFNITCKWLCSVQSTLFKTNWPRSVQTTVLCKGHDLLLEPTPSLPPPLSSPPPPPPLHCWFFETSRMETASLSSDIHFSSPSNSDCNQTSALQFAIDYRFLVYVLELGPARVYDFITDFDSVIICICMSVVICVLTVIKRTWQYFKHFINCNKYCKHLQLQELSTFRWLLAINAAQLKF